MDSLLDSAPCGFLSFADDGTVEAVNATLLEMLGYRSEEVVGSHVEKVLTVGTRIFYQTHWFPLLRMHGGAEEIFLMLRGSSGEEIGMLVNAVRRQRNAHAVYDCVLMRVHERQKFEDELLRARRVAEQARSDAEAQRNDLRRMNEQLAAQTLELELQQHQLQEQATELEATGEELRTANEELLERTEELERLRGVADEANQAKSAFLAVMSHELRTPLNAIAGYVELIEMGIHGPVTDPQREALSRIKRSQRHLLRLINDILNLSRIEAGRVDYQIARFRVAGVIEEVAPMVEPQLSAKGLRFETNVPADLLVAADREKMQQIVLNLLSNAIKFTPGGGTVTVSAGRPQDAPGMISLTVRDNGIGIPADKVDRVFEPFVQVDVSRTSRKEGTGLGLAISRDLARGMGGDLRARSEDGKGSTFTLTLPASEL